jgi:restriction endonuclease S subunit
MLPAMKIEPVGLPSGLSHTIMSSVDTFKSAVIRIRDILRGPGVAITGMDSMRHICLYLLSRYMERAKVAALGVPETLCWENFITMIRTQNGGKQRALDLFYHPEVDDCLIKQFDRLFDTSDFPFSIKNIHKHAEILEILDAVNMEYVDCQMDVLGWVYEQHLRTGSSAARDLGQFFTDRFICEYMTELCKPAFKCAGVPESVCDPSMGTGGFLTSYVKYYKKHHPDTPVDWSVQQKEIHGCDTDPKVAGVARLNLFMETGGHRAENLRTHDSLYGDLTLTGYDVILANMPFGVKGIKHAECCERVKALAIRGTKSEPLFLQLMMVSLNPGGRCAVVVPDGMLVNTSVCHDGTRKYLLDHFDLKRVIKMKGQFFMNTGIQPSILFFEKTGKPTEAVEFWEVVKGDKGKIAETMVVSVPSATIKGDASCSLDMRRYLESEKPMANPTGFPMVNISEQCSMAIGGTPLRSKHEYYDNGHYVWVSVSELNNNIIMDSKEHINDEGVKHSNVKLVKKGSVLMSFKMSIGKCAIAGVDLYTNEAIVAFYSKDETVLSNKYLFYYLCLRDFSNAGKGSIGAGSMNKESLSELMMPLPPLPIQQEIVATLDRIYNPGTTELADTLKMTDKAMDLVLANPGGATLEPIVEAQRLIRKSAQMVADVKAQMVADVKAQMVAVVKASMAGSGCTKYILSDLANDNPDNLTKADKFETINYVDLGSVKEGNISTIQTIPFEEKPSRAQRKIQTGDIIWGGVRPLSRSYAFIDTALENMIGSSGFVVVRNKDTAKVLSKYLYYVLTTDDCVNYLNSHSTGSSYPAFNASTIMAYEVVIPSIAIQTKTLERLTVLQSQLTVLESLQRQSEDNGRFILESYLTPAADVISHV